MSEYLNPDVFPKTFLFLMNISKIFPRVLKFYYLLTRIPAPKHASAFWAL